VSRIDSLSMITRLSRPDGPSSVMLAAPNSTGRYLNWTLRR
jgi:hypothetical protein